MRNLFAWALAAVMAIGCGRDQDVKRAKADAVETLASKTVALVRTDGDSVGPFCSGVWVDTYKILTANHCVKKFGPSDPVNYVTKGDVYETGTIRIREGGRSRVSRVLDRDELHDLALLETADVPAHGVARLPGEDPRAGDFAQSMGHPVGLWWSYSSGDVASIRFTDTGMGAMVFVQSTVPISNGSSGGGLFNANLELIGITHGMAHDAQNANLFVHPTYIRTFLGLF